MQPTPRCTNRYGVMKMSTDPLWCYENYEASAECIDQQEIKIAELQASNINLREALASMVDMCITHIGSDYNDEIHTRYEKAKQVLATTPAQSLQSHDNEVIEKCAKVCDEYNGTVRATAENIAFKIRALKDKV